MRAERWQVSEGWTGTIEAMTHSAPSRYPITVTRLPLVRCAVCRRTIAHRPGDASVVLTKHYEKDTSGDGQRRLVVLLGDRRLPLSAGGVRAPSRPGCVIGGCRHRRVGR